MMALGRSTDLDPEPVEHPAVVNLSATLNSGQVFHWIATENGFAGCIDQTPVHLMQSELDTPGANRIGAAVRKYLGIHHPIQKILRTFPDDPVMLSAVQFCPGLRVIEQPSWECLATFLTSALKQVSHIRAITLLLRERFGRPVELDGMRLHSYPSPSAIARLTLADLLACKLGFRAQNLLAAARLVESGELDLLALRDRPTKEALDQLCRVPGVGSKIANCVLLFAYQRFDCFPIDVWVARALRETYFPARAKISLKEMQVFAASYFGPYAGYAQQFLFHHWRLTKGKR